MMNFLQRTPTILFLCLSITVAAFAQNQSGWTRIETPEFSFAVPSSFVVDTEKRGNGPQYRFFASENGVLFSVTINAEKNAKAKLENLRFSTTTKVEAFKKGNFDLVYLPPEATDKIYRETVYLASKGYYYTISVKSENKSAPAISRFTHSVLVENSELFVTKTPYPDLPRIDLATLKTSPEVTKAYAPKANNYSGVVTYKKYSERPTSTPADPTVVRALILEDLRPDLRNVLGPDPTKGFAADVRVELLADGSIGNVLVYSDSGRDFSTALAEAAKAIKFVPARSGGTFVVSEYSSNLEIRALPVSGPFRISSN